MSPSFGRKKHLHVALVALAISTFGARADAEGVKVTVGKPPQGTISLGNDQGGKGGTTKLVPPIHNVKKGDTLWDICDHYFSNPWNWPRVWSYNPDIVNPHWIYPGQQVKLKKDAVGYVTLSPGGVKAGAPLKPKLVPTGTVFLQNVGYVYDDKVENIGEITGSPEDKMLLTTLDRVYVRLGEEQVKNTFVGDTITVYTVSRPVKKGTEAVGYVVEILGSIRIDHIDKKTRLAEGVITEALDVIERGAKVAPIERKLDVVAPATNEVEQRGSLLESVRPNQLYGTNQVVLIDKGDAAGLKPGNRLFVVRKGDPWQEDLSSAGALGAAKVKLSTDGPAEVEGTKKDASADYPDEVVAEIRVIRVRKNTATCLVTHSKRELVSGDTWLAKKGY